MIARVLVVDDDETILLATSRVLVRAGFDVTLAVEAVPAMDLDERFDIVIADFHMRTASGADVVRHFKRRFGAQVYCAVMSGEDCDDTRTACFDAGADAVLLKPTSAPELRKRLIAAAASLRDAQLSV